MPDRGCWEQGKLASAQSPPSKSLQSRHLLEEFFFQLGAFAEVRAKFAQPRRGIIFNKRRLFGQQFEIRSVGFRFVFDQVVVERPGVGVGVGGGARIAQPAAVGQQAHEGAFLPAAADFRETLSSRG